MSANWHASCITIGIHRMVRSEGTRKDNIMAHFNVHAVKSYALAAFASVYASVMLLAIVGQNGAQVGSLVI
jgi:hypothetical protein